MSQRPRFVVAAALASIALFFGLMTSATAQTPRIALVEDKLPAANMTIERHAMWASLLEELQALGYTEGQTITIERWSGVDNAFPDLAALARAVSAGSPDVVVARGHDLVEAFQTAATTVPVIGIGMYPSAANGETIAPGGNITGFNELDRSTLYDKHLQILHDAVPTAQRVAYLAPADYWEGLQGALVRAAAERLSLEVVPVIVAQPIGAGSVLRALSRITAEEFDAFYVSENLEIQRHRRLVVDRTQGTRLPAIAYHPDFAQFGLMTAYGANFLDLYRRAAGYVDRILKGTAVSELPFGQPEKFNFVINFATAERIGVTIPQHLIDEATEFWD